MEELIKRLERVIQTGAPDKDGMHPISAETVLEVVNELSEHGMNLASLGTDCISRQAAISAICNACGKIDCDKMDKCEKLQLPPANCSEFPNNSDAISRQAAIDAVMECYDNDELFEVYEWKLNELPPIQPEIVRCKDCIYYDPPHVENNGVRYEYDEMPADAFDALGTGLVTAEYGINIGGRCCVDYYCKNYSDDKRVYVREDNYCGRAERRTDE